MVDVKLKEVLLTKSGLNSRELKKNSFPVYTIADFNYDLKNSFKDKKGNTALCDDLLLNTGDIVMSLQKFKIAMVSKKNSKKVLSQRFLRLVPRDSKNVYLPYLVFLMNESIMVRKQVFKLLEGSVLKILKETNVKNIDIYLPTMKKQKQIGRYYYLIKEREYLIWEKMSLLDKLSMEYLNKLI